MVLTNANSTKEPKINAVQTINHISVALIYETFGNELPVFLDNVMNVNIVLVPKLYAKIKYTLFFNDKTLWQVCNIK